MKKLIYLITIVWMIPWVTGCDDFLDSQSYTTKNSETFPRTEDDANQMVVGVYNSLTKCTNQVMSSYFMLAELSSDDRFGGGGYNDKASQAVNHHLYSDPNLTSGLWSSHYTGIARANAALAALETLDDGDMKNQKFGEVRVMRAFFYFEMVQLLGDIPLMKAAPENVQEAKQSPAQSPQEDIYKLIASDLWQAYSTMPSVKWNTYTSGTVTKWAAAGLLARVFLFYTGFYNKETLPTEDGQITSTQVIAALKDCIDNSGHSLLPDFRSLWAYTNSVSKKDYPYAKDLPTWVRDGENPEHVFVKKMVPHASWQSNPQCNEYCLYFAIRNGNNTDYKGMFPMGQGWGMGPVNSRLWDEWVIDEPNDLRRRGSIWNQEVETVFVDGVETKVDYDGQWGADRQVEETGMWQKKVVSTTAYGKGTGGQDLWNAFTSAPDYFNLPGDNFQHGYGTDLIYIRYADILLMHSELTKTADGLNAVRRRVQLPDVGYSDNALRKERRYELAFEGLRWGDIRRWHIAEEALAKMYGVPIFNESNWTVMKPQGPNIADRYKATQGFFMIPQTQIDLADGALKQNAGWGNDAVFTQWSE